MTYQIINLETGEFSKRDADPTSSAAFVRGHDARR